GAALVRCEWAWSVRLGGPCAETALPEPACAVPNWPLEAEQPTASGETTPWFPSVSWSVRPVMAASRVPSYVLSEAEIDAVTLRWLIVAVVLAEGLVSW